MEIVILFQIVVIAWIYGLKNICRDLEFMLKQRTFWYWKICWGGITPVALCVVLVAQLVLFEPVEGIPTSATGKYFLNRNTDFIKYLQDWSEM